MILIITSGLGFEAGMFTSIFFIIIMTFQQSCAYLAIPQSLAHWHSQILQLAPGYYVGLLHNVRNRISSKVLGMTSPNFSNAAMETSQVRLHWGTVI